MNKKIPFLIALIIILFLAGIVVVLIISMQEIGLGEDKERMKDDLLSKDLTFNVLSIDEVLSNPKKFNNKKIKLQGIYYESIEKVVLISEIIVHPTGWRSIPSEQIWVHWGIYPPKDLSEQLNKIQGVGEDDLYGEVIVEGIFNYSSRSGIGHEGKYKYSFTIEDFQLVTEKQEKKFNLNQLDEYLVSLAEISGASTIKEISLNEWELTKKEKEKVLLLKFEDKNNKIIFIAIPSKHCFMFDEDGGMLYGGDIEDFFSYINPVGGREDKYKSGEYQFCLRMSILNSDPYNLQNGIYYFEDNINIPRDCSIDMNNIDKECVLEITKENLSNSINNGFNVIFKSDLSWVTEEIKKETERVKEIFEKMTFFYEIKDVFLVNYESSIGSLIIVTNLNNEILGLIQFGMSI